MKYQKKVLIVCSDYYSIISNNLLKDAIKRLDIAKIKTNIIKVPGVFEIPFIIGKNIHKYDGFVALGCVIKGQTPHFDFISKASINGIMNLSIEHKKPIGNGILTCLTMNQAITRSSHKGNKRKGKEAAEALISVLKIK